VKGKLKVMVSMFGRETPVELDALQVKQLWYNYIVTQKLLKINKDIYGRKESYWKS
jgi:hypothetical protein